MTVYDQIISRTDAAAFIPESVSNLMLTNLAAQSIALELGTRIPMATKSTRFPILSALPVAYWVNGDTGLKKTTQMAWDNKYMTVEELATIVPIPENVIDDASFDVWSQVRPAVEAAISRKIDEAIFFDAGSPPASFPDAIITQAVAAGNVVARGTSTAAEGGLYGDYSDLLGTLEAEGYMPNGAVGNITLRARERSVRDTLGQRLDRPEDMPTIRWGLPGLWPTASDGVELVLGDFANLAVGVRQDFSYKLLDQAVITDETGAVIFNLPQQDMVALRVTFRMGWAVANPINWQQPVEASRFPFAVLVGSGD